MRKLIGIVLALVCTLAMSATDVPGARINKVECTGSVSCSITTGTGYGSGISTPVINTLTITGSSDGGGGSSSGGGPYDGGTVGLDAGISTPWQGMQTFSVSGATWVTANTRIVCGVTYVDGGMTPEVAALAQLSIVVGNVTSGAFSVYVYSPNGAVGNFAINCVGAL